MKQGNIAKNLENGGWVMNLDTKNFGLIEIDDEKILDFPEGIPGFEDVKKFVLLGKLDGGLPFQWLQGVNNTDLAFVVIDPRLIKPDYIVDADDSEVEVLGVRDVNNVLVLSIVVVPEDIAGMTANLKAPVLINTENNKGKQVVNNNYEYPVKYYIIEELRRIGG
jgi:flagellar assembly factor FliW